MKKHLVMLTAEQYSDFTIGGTYLVPSLEWLKEKVTEYRATLPAPARCDVYKLADWLLATYPNDVEQALYDEVWIGGYGNWSKEFGGSE